MKASPDKDSYGASPARLKQPVRPPVPEREESSRSNRLSTLLGNRGMSELLNSGVIQAKLPVSQPGDADELEADRIGDQVAARPPAESFPGGTASGVTPG